MFRRNSFISLICTFCLSLIFHVNPVNAESMYTNSYTLTSSPTIFAELKFEAKEKTSLENPVIDPNFNVMRNSDMNKSLSIILVGGILLIAVVTPIATWWYFSK